MTLVGRPTVENMHAGHHEVPETTHTLELAQVRELNQHLAAGPVPLADDRPITRVEYEGSPAFPWVYGIVGGSGERVMLHTADLHTISRALNLRHHWGLAGSG